MIENVSHRELLRPGAATLLEAELSGAKAYGLQVQQGHVLVRNNDVLPVIDGKTSTAEYAEYAAHRYTLSEPVREVGALSSMVLIAGSTNYYHFLMFNLPGTIFLRSAQGPRVTLGIVNPFPKNGEALIHALLPQIAGRPVDVVTVGPGDYVARDVILRAVPMMPFSVAFLKTMQSLVGRRAPESGTFKIFVRRDGGRGGRMLLNQAEVEAWWVKRGYASVDPGCLSLEDQIALFARATHVVGVEGAGLANLVFTTRVRHVVVLASPATKNEQFFPNLAECAGLPLTTLYGEIAPDQAPDQLAHRRADFVMPMDRVIGLHL